VERPSGFFQGSELPRLLVLALVMVAGWALVWHFAGMRPQAAEPPPIAVDKPEPIVADRSVEFETVTDRTPIGFRDDAAYALLLNRARGKTANELAAVSRRDVGLPHLWQSPELYRGIPVHLLGTARRVLRYPCKLTPNGWIYEASIITPDAPRNPYVCMFEEAPEGLPIGPDVSERVVFNGYFLKIWKYQATDVARGAPLLVGRIGWQPSEPTNGDGKNSLLRWSLIAIAIMFLISLGRWAYQLFRMFTVPADSRLPSKSSPSEELDPRALSAWAQSMRPAYESTDDEDDTDER
jgi:hypothetical protein